MDVSYCEAHIGRQIILKFCSIHVRKQAPFVWNTTHLSAQMRKKTLDLLYAYDAEVELVYLEQPPQVIFKRNTQRDTSLSNKSIERMLFKWEVPLPTEAHQVKYHHD